MAVACALLLLAGCGVDAQPLSNTTSLPVNYAPDATVADLNSGAIATAQAAVDARPQDAAAWYQLGNAISVSAAEISDDNLRQASYNKAIAAYLRALELNPTDGAAMHNLGTAYLQIGKLADARKQFEVALTVDGDGLGPRARGSEDCGDTIRRDLRDVVRALVARAAPRGCGEAAQEGHLDRALHGEEQLRAARGTHARRQRRDALHARGEGEAEGRVEHVGRRRGRADAQEQREREQEGARR